jgi:membrane associated rhomboid family serine protease
VPLLSRYNSGGYSEEQFQLEKRIVRHALFVSSALIVILWIIKFFEVEYKLDFSGWGILPLTVRGLRGIFFAPLIHATFDHLMANTLPLFILTFSLFFFYRKSSYVIFALIYLLTGLFVWLAGREALHIGASGIIYGLAAFLFLSGIISFNIRLLTISMIVALVYGGLFWGIFPVKPEISWESHLWGGVAGFGLALLFRKSAPASLSDIEQTEEKEDEEMAQEHNSEAEHEKQEENN